MTNKVDSLERAMADFQAKTSKELGDVRVAQEKGHADMQAGISTTLKGVQDSVSQQLIAIRQDNGKSLEQIRATVDDKLQKTLNDRISKSFEVFWSLSSTVARICSRLLPLSCRMAISC